MARTECLFLHVPKLVNHYRPFGEFIRINFLPMGLLGLADLLHRNGISTQVVHMGVEWIQDHRFSILDEIREKKPRIIAIDLHWHHQSFDVMETVKKIKAAFPSVYVLLGGYTASFFHEEIMRNFDGVDAVIRGEAEVPLLELTRVILRGEEDFFSIPNLTWRRKKRVMINPLSYVASEEDLNTLSFTNFPLLKNYPTYIRYIGQPFYMKGLSKEKNFRISSSHLPVFQLTVGRGCPVQCTWCGGGFLSLKTITGREKVTFRGMEEVLQTIKEAASFGYESIYISFDPYPREPDYFLRLFSRMREEKVNLACFFESFSLPTADFIQSFKKTFPGPGSRIILSPDVGSVKLRRIHKGYAYTNRDLMECLDRMKENRVSCDLFFTLG
ncbi:MAG: radical SAM protein, partial [Deltaproteobacteria bacterium]